MDSGMKSKLIVFLLILSLVANAYFVLFEEQPSLEGGQVKEMQTRINTLQGPAVFQTVKTDQTGPFIRQSTSKKGALLNISVEIRPEKAACSSRQRL